MEQSVTDTSQQRVVHLGSAIAGEVDELTKQPQGIGSVWLSFVGMQPGPVVPPQAQVTVIGDQLLLWRNGRCKHMLGIRIDNEAVAIGLLPFLARLVDVLATKMTVGCPLSLLVKCHHCIKFPEPIACRFESPSVAPSLIVRIPVGFDIALPALHHVDYCGLCLRFGVARLTPLLCCPQDRTHISAQTDQSTKPKEHLHVPSGGELWCSSALGQHVQYGTTAACSDVALAGQQLAQSYTIFYLAEYCLRVALRISLTIFSP